ncbi:hypothetical protein CEXT_483811, partial [Caerostris extrusa]
RGLPKLPREVSKAAEFKLRLKAEDAVKVCRTLGILQFYNSK